MTDINMHNIYTNLSLYNQVTISIQILKFCDLPRTKHTFQRQLSWNTEALTSAVGETVVAGGASGALAADDVWPAGALAAHGVAGGAGGAGLVAVAGQCPVVVQCHQGASRVTTEL